MKQFISQIKTLSNVKPDSAWKAKNREILYNQISSTQNAENLSAFNLKHFFNNNLVIQYTRTMPQSTMVAVFIFVFLIGGSIASLRASENSVPGDSFYIAKIMSEKTQQVLTFDEKSKALLGIEFAGNRAKEINQVLAQSESSPKSEKKVEQLVVNFKKEIQEAKSRLEKINQNKTPESKTELVEIPEIKNENPIENELADNTEDETGVFSANTGKDDSGIEVYDPSAGIKEPVDAVENKEIETAKTSSTTEQAVAAVDPQDILKKAGDFLNSDDIDSTLSLMEEAGEVIEKVGLGQIIKEEEAGASSTEKVE